MRIQEQLGEIQILNASMESIPFISIISTLKLFLVSEAERLDWFQLEMSICLGRLAHSLMKSREWLGTKCPIN